MQRLRRGDPRESTELFSQIAEEHHVVIIYLFLKRDDGCYYNLQQ